MDKTTDYLALLLHSFEMEMGISRSHDSKLEFLSECIFNFTTYDSEMSEMFAQHAVDVCNAISSKQTFEFIEEPENYKWYLLLCNTPFFSEKLEWGTSIRGAWWKHGGITLSSYGLWDGDEQITGISFKANDWNGFVDAMSKFVGADVGKNNQPGEDNG